MHMDFTPRSEYRPDASKCYETSAVAVKTCARTTSGARRLPRPYGLHPMHAGHSASLHPVEPRICSPLLTPLFTGAVWPVVPSLLWRVPLAQCPTREPSSLSFASWGCTFPQSAVAACVINAVVTSISCKGTSSQTYWGNYILLVLTAVRNSAFATSRLAQKTFFLSGFEAFASGSSSCWAVSSTQTRLSTFRR